MKELESAYIKKIKNENLLPDIKGKALDLGCGTGNDAISLAAMGFNVDAVDQNQVSIDTLTARAKESNLSVNAYYKDINHFEIQAGKYSVIICNNVLSFLKNKEEVFGVIRKISDGLIPQGVTYFTIFGPHDEWMGNKEMSFLEYEDVLKFLDDLPFKIYHRSTEEGYGKKMDGTIKYWHIHRFFCTKK